LVTAVQPAMSKTRRALLGVAVLVTAGAVWTALGAGIAVVSAAPAESRTTTQPAGGDSRRLRIPADEMAQMEAFLKQYMPDLLARIERLREDDPAEAWRQLHRAYRFWWRVRDYPAEIREAAVACRRLSRTIYQTVRERQQALSPAEKAALTENLREILGQHFDKDQLVKEYRVRYLTRQLAELSGKVQQRRKSRSGLIQERLARLLRPATQPAATRPAPRQGRMQRSMISPERQAELKRFLKERTPELHAQLERLQKEDPDKARRLLERAYRLWRRVRAYPPEVRDAALARQRLNVAVAETLEKIRKSKDPTQRTEPLQTLRKLLGRQFDYEQIVQEYRVKRLSRQLAELRAEVERRRRSRAKIIAEWLDRLSRAPLATQPAAAPPSAMVAP